MSSVVSGGYVHKPGGPSWHEWLILQEQRQIELEAAQRTAEPIVRTIKEARDETRQALETLADTSAEAAAYIRDQSQSINEMSLSIGEFHADFNWHMGRVEVKLEHVEAILSKISEELSRRHRNEAFEFYSQSREYAEYEMFQKALDSIEVAIHGDARGARGYELERRFWST